jgi:CheY-like chemotaxis protein
MTGPNQPIFLIEDNPMDVDLTRRAFSRQKISNPIIVARDGVEALEWMKRWDAGEQTPVVILLDLKLPRINGLQVLKALKNHPVYFSIPVVVLTTSAEETDIKNAYAFGANSYLVKPIDFDQFIEIAELIEHYWNELNKAPR